MSYAVVKVQGKQHRVEEGDEIVVDKLSKEEGEKFVTSQVLLTSKGDQVKIGQPLVEKASVSFVVKKHQKAPKIRVATYKAKARQRRVIGHRQHQTVLVVEKIKP